MKINPKTKNSLVSELVFCEKLPTPTEIGENSFLIFDERLLKNKEFKKWTTLFSLKLSVRAGEELKQIKTFETHFMSCLKLLEKANSKKITVVAVGGGSVGDFAGFLASVFKRGVPLVHIPSTWLAAIDSSHGGKTALNVGGYKNQLGTFYSAQKNYLVKELLFSQPAERVTEAMGEVLKTVLLSGGPLWKRASVLGVLTKETLWSLLPELIQYKIKIVKKDPFETKGLRYFLNLGHTYGHAIESIYKLPHGIAVNYGLRLALEISVARGIMSSKEYQKICKAPLFIENLVSKDLALGAVKKIKTLKQQLSQDKKAGIKNEIRYVYLKKIGSALVKETSVDELVQFIKGGYVIEK